MISYFKTTARTRVGVASKNKKIRDRVDSEGQYGRWKLRVISSWDRGYLKSKRVLGSEFFLS